MVGATHFHDTVILHHLTQSHLPPSEVGLASSVMGEGLLCKFLVDGAVEPQQESKGQEEYENEVKPHHVNLNVRGDRSNSTASLNLHTIPMLLNNKSVCASRGLRGS